MKGLALSSLLENSFRFTREDTETALGVTTSPRTGEDTGPREVPRRAGEARYVLMGEFVRGMGSRPFLRAVRTSCGSGIVPTVQGSAINEQHARCWFMR